MLTNLDDLKRALANDELAPHFQPIVELRNGRLAGFEVLTRWEHPVHGAFLPSNMISLAEANGLIGELARQVFSKAFLQVKSSAEPLELSVNLSPLQLAYPDLIEQIEGMARHAEFPLSRLTLEITESALIEDLSRAKKGANELKELGCRLSLDDFGTGYSSLAHLQALPFDELKIDRAFVSKMTKKRESRKIVAAIIGLGQSLGLSTVAEGIETAEQADMLVWLGSELGQGWHYGRPAPFHAIRSMVAGFARLPAAELPSPGEDWSVSSLEAFPTQRLAQLQAIYDGAPVGLCFLDRHLRYVSINQRLAEMNEISVAAHIGRKVEEVVPELYPHVEPYLLRALAGEPVAGVEAPRPRKNTEEVGWIMLSYQPAFDEADEVIGISISVMDISESKRAREALQEHEFVQRHIMEQSRQVPWTMDAEGNNLQMSSQWVQQVHGAPYLSRNLGWLEALHADDLKPAIRKMKQALRTGKPIDMQYRVQNTEGEWRWMRSRGLPRLDADGKIARWYGSVEDIHEKKCAEDEARKAALARRAQLNAVPVAVPAAAGNQRAVQKSAELLLDTTTGPRSAGSIRDHIFTGDEEIAADGGRGKRAVKKKKPPTAMGPPGVEDLNYEAKEHDRLVSMLADFAEMRPDAPGGIDSDQTKDAVVGLNEKTQSK